MKMITFECPKCKADLKIEADKKMAYCLYCGQKIYLDDEVKRSEHVYRKVDEARIKEAESKAKKAEAEKELKIKELEYKERSEKRESRAVVYSMLFAVGLIVIGLLGLGISEHNDKKKAAEMEAQGYISAGHYSNYTEKNYESVTAQIQARGFTDIETIELNDVWFLSTKKNTVESVSINGDSSFDTYDYFKPDAKVIITYH